MIRRKRGSETGDIFQDLMPEPETEPEETDAQRRRKREVEYYSDVQYRDLDYENPIDPPEDPNVKAVREWAEKNLPEYEHSVRSKRVQFHPGLVWRITFRDDADEEFSVSLACKLRPNLKFPDNLHVFTILSSWTRDKDTPEAGALWTLIGKPLSLTNLRTKIRKVFRNED
jgi:hypothetical protein